MRPPEPEPDPLPLRVDVINGWPLSPSECHIKSPHLIDERESGGGEKKKKGGEAETRKRRRRRRRINRKRASKTRNAISYWPVEVLKTGLHREAAPLVKCPSQVTPSKACLVTTKSIDRSASDFFLSSDNRHR